MRRTTALLVLWSLVATCAAGADPPGADEIVARAVIEARGRTHGEARLVRRDRAAVVQTLLVTRSLARAAGRIRDKDEASWPRDSQGYGASQLYLSALEDAVRAVLETEQTDRTRKLLIEVELSQNAGGVIFGKPVIEDAGGRFTLVGAETITRLEVPCSWARREMELIADDRGLDLEKLAPLPTCGAR